ncbi:MAG: hypothetical protein R3F19_20205 [Verrucomicrobiales bacterium]
MSDALHMMNTLPAPDEMMAPAHALAVTSSLGRRYKDLGGFIFLLFRPRRGTPVAGIPADVYSIL